MTETDITRFEDLLGRVLLGGVLSASGCLAAGLALWVAHLAPSLANPLLTAGLIILMATPILRVVVSVFEYVRMRDWFFVGTTLIVLMVLLVTILVAVHNAKP
jgi:hypothetical protein